MYIYIFINIIFYTFNLIFYTFFLLFFFFTFNFLYIFLTFFFLVMPCYIWDFSSPNTLVQGVEPMSPGLEVRSLNHRTTRKVQIFLILYEIRICEDLKEEKCINRVLKYEGELARWRGKKTEKGLGWG